MKTEDASLLVEYFGKHLIVRMVDFLVENRLFDFSRKQVMEGIGISKASLRKHWDKPRLT